MIMIKPKCPKCGKLMNSSWLRDSNLETYTKFHICYCPYCIKLDAKIEATCWARTEMKEVKE